MKTKDYINRLKLAGIILGIAAIAQLIFACEEAEVTPDPLEGRWYYDAAFKPVYVDFMSEKTGSGYSLKDGRLIYYTVPESDRSKNTVTFSGESNTGIQAITIESTGNTPYSMVFLDGEFDERGWIRFKSVQINLPNEALIILDNPLLKRDL